MQPIGRCRAEIDVRRHAINNRLQPIIERNGKHLPDITCSKLVLGQRFQHLRVRWRVGIQGQDAKNGAIFVEESLICPLFGRHASGSGKARNNGVSFAKNRLFGCNRTRSRQRDQRNGEQNL